MKVFKNTIKTTFAGILLLNAAGAFAQARNNGPETNTGSVAAAHFLNLNSDPLSHGMANIRNADPNSPYAISNNLSKIAFNTASERGHSADFLHAYAMAYSPLVQSISKDIKMLNFSSHHWLSGGGMNGSYLAFGIHYLGYGDMRYADGQGNDIGFHRPNEYAVSLGYAKRFGEFFALGVTPKFVRTNLTGGALSEYGRNADASAFALDLSAYGESPYGSFGEADNSVTYGISVQNIGTKVNYNMNNATSNLPTNLSGALGWRGASSDVGYLVAAEISQPLYPDRFVKSGIGGAGLSLGGEVSLAERLYVRGGFAKESAYRNGIRMATFGAGFSVDVAEMPFRIGGSYQMPLGNGHRTIGLKNTYSIGISTVVLDGR